LYNLFFVHELKPKGKTRHDLGREELLRRIETYAQESHDTIIRQMKKLGSSLDWSREAYTLDAERNLAVRTAFKKMYDDGLIYQGARIVNWDPKLQTTVSDDEIEWKEEQIPFYYLQYGPFVISTARPETKFGDKYVVMHPDDTRYKEYTHGQKIEVEWMIGTITASSSNLVSPCNSCAKAFTCPAVTPDTPPVADRMALSFACASSAAAASVTVLLSSPIRFWMPDVMPAKTDRPAPRPSPCMMA
jgi:valyl-tRNA synthetase